METVQEVVREAATMMDEMYPGWYDLIDTSSLNIENPCNCITGQLNDRGVEFNFTREEGFDNLFGFGPWFYLGNRFSERVGGEMVVIDEIVVNPFASRETTEFWVEEINTRRESPIVIKHKVKEAELIPA